MRGSVTASRERQPAAGKKLMAESRMVGLKSMQMKREVLAEDDAFQNRSLEEQLTAAAAASAWSGLIGTDMRAFTLLRRFLLKGRAAASLQTAQEPERKCDSLGMVVLTPVPRNTKLNSAVPASFFTALCASVSLLEDERSGLDDSRGWEAGDAGAASAEHSPPIAACTGLECTAGALLSAAAS